MVELRFLLLVKITIILILGFTNLVEVSRKWFHHSEKWLELPQTSAKSKNTIKYTYLNAVFNFYNWG